MLLFLNLQSQFDYPIWLLVIPFQRRSPVATPRPAFTRGVAVPGRCTFTLPTFPLFCSYLLLVFVYKPTLPLTDLYLVRDATLVVLPFVTGPIYLIVFPYSPGPVCCC